MSANISVMGLIFASMHDSSIIDLTKLRTCPLGDGTG